MATGDDHREAVQKARKRMGEVGKALVAQLEAFGCEDVKLEQYGWVTIGDHTILHIHPAGAHHDAKLGGYRSSLQLTITHERGRAEHYPEPKDGWSDDRLKGFAMKAKMEASARDAVDREHEERQERRSQKEAAAERLNEQLGTKPFSNGWISVDPRSAFHVWIPSDLTEGEACLLAKFVQVLPDWKHQSNVPQDRLGEGRIYVVWERDDDEGADDD